MRKKIDLQGKIKQLCLSRKEQNVKIIGENLSTGKKKDQADMLTSNESKIAKRAELCIRQHRSRD